MRSKLQIYESETELDATAVRALLTAVHTCLRAQQDTTGLPAVGADNSSAQGRKNRFSDHTGLTPTPPVKTLSRKRTKGLQITSSKLNMQSRGGLSSVESCSSNKKSIFNGKKLWVRSGQPDPDINEAIEKIEQLQRELHD